MTKKKERGKQRKAALAASKTLTLLRKGDNSTTLSLAVPAFPPQAYRVSGAGTEFVNGLYEYYNNEHGMRYQYTVPDDESIGAGKTLTLFQCTMRSQVKWWFISEADPDQPGTDQDIDYYQFKTPHKFDVLPGLSSWVTVKEGVDPPPILEAKGKLSFKIEHTEIPSGTLSAVLNFLGRCENETFDEVMLDVGGGDLSTPVTWINILLRMASEERCQQQISQNIGPLVKCMCNDTTRLFFKSNKHWRDAILPFVNLVGNMIQREIDSNEGKSQVIESLLQNEGLLTSIIQWGFWSIKELLPSFNFEIASANIISSYGRPDIVEELGINICAKIVTWGKMATRMVLIDAIPNKKRLRIISSIPIISEAYDPNCMISCVAGFIWLMKINGRNQDDFSILHNLFAEADCVDKGVITELISFGLGETLVTEGSYQSITYIMREEDTELVTGLSCAMITSQDMNYSCDTRNAFAIRAGLVEMCLKFIHFRKSESSLFDEIEHLLKVVHSISFHKKTFKAISHKKGDIKKKLKYFENDTFVSKTDIENNPKCKRILDMVRYIIDMNGSYCCRCNKSLRKTEVKLCNGCGCMVYCSETCQKEDWLNGHSITCCKISPNLSGQFQGRILPEEMPSDERATEKLRELEINVNMIQLKLFFEHSETILNQARALGLPLCDCVVGFDLSQCPPLVLTKSYIDWLHTPELQKVFEDSRSKMNITCLYFVKIYNVDLNEEGGIPDLVMKRFFPHEWLMKIWRITSTLMKSLQCKDFFILDGPEGGGQTSMRHVYIL